MSQSTPTTHPPDCEYLVIGSGEGGGTVAARLAEAGKRRARRRMYHEMSKIRHTMNTVPHYEPTGDEVFE